MSWISDQLQSSSTWPQDAGSLICDASCRSTWRLPLTGSVSVAVYHMDYTWLKIGGGQREDSLGGFKEYSWLAASMELLAFKLSWVDVHCNQLNKIGGGTWHNMNTED